MDEAKIITNNFQGNTTVLQSVENIDSALPEWFRPYEKELNIRKKKIDLRQATEALINQKKVFRSLDVDRVKGYLNGNNVCLVKASEGRGKTFLSRIVAYDFHRENKEVYFVDFCDVEEEYNGSEKDPINRIENVLNNWESNTETKYLLVLENVHACPKLEDLIEVVGDRRCADTETEKGNVQILLNSRPTDEGVNYFEEWNEVVVLHPDEDAVREVINIYSNEEKDRNPFENDDSDEAFVSSICSNNNQNGTNLRWLGYYLWTWMSDSTIHHVSDVDEDKIIEKVKKNYKLDRINIDDLQGLLYFSSIFQFGVSLHRDIISCLKGLTDGSGKNRLDRFVRKPYNILSKKQGRYFMAHSFDAYILSKAICNYEGYNYKKRTKEIVKAYVNAILGSGNPSDSESDFKLLISGLLAKKDEFMEVIFCLTNVGMAEKIMKNINPGFVISFFHLENHKNSDPDALIEYYRNNMDDYLRSIIFNLPPHLLRLVLRNFSRELGLNIVRDIFATSDKINAYLKTKDNDKSSDRLLLLITHYDSQYTTELLDYYRNNKGLLNGLSATAFKSIYVFFKKSNYDFIKDIIKTPEELDDCLAHNNKLLVKYTLLKAFTELGDEFKPILVKHYVENIALLKPMLLKKTPIKLSLLYQCYKKDLNCDIVKDIFNDVNFLDEYMKIYSGRLSQLSVIMVAIREMSDKDKSDKHKRILYKYGFLDYKFWTAASPNSIRVNPKILFAWRNPKIQHKINYNLIENAGFYFDGVSWGDLAIFVHVIGRDMNDLNHQLSIKIVNEIFQIVLDREKCLSYATSKDLSYFYYNITAVDKDIANNLMRRECVIADIKRRLENTTYSVDDLNLFGFFYQHPWCKDKLESRILNADNDQQKIINEWREELVKRLVKRGEGNVHGTLLDFLINGNTPLE